VAVSLYALKRGVDAVTGWAEKASRETADAPTVAIGNSMRELNSMIRNLDRGERYGGQINAVLDAQQRMNFAWEDLKDRLMESLSHSVVPLLDGLTVVVKGIEDLITPATEAIAAMPATLELMLDQLPLIEIGAERRAELIRGLLQRQINLRKKDQEIDQEKVTDRMFRELFNQRPLHQSQMQEWDAPEQQPVGGPLLGDLFGG
jgi:hypothetical protein